VRENKGTEDELLLYVTIRPTERWFDRSISIEETPVRSLEELKLLAYDNPSFHARLSGPLLRMKLVYIEEKSSVGIISNRRPFNILPAIS